MSERELSLIVQQMQGKLSRKDALLVEAAEVLREIGSLVALDLRSGECIYCSNDIFTTHEHKPQCSWARIAPLLDKLGERE